MNAEPEAGRERKRTTFIALAVLAVTMAFSLILARAVEPPSTRSLACAASLGGGIMVLAWVIGRGGAYPRWSIYAAASVLVISLFASLGLSDPTSWMKEIWPTFLIYPSYFMVFATSPGRASASCAAATARRGWLLIACALILALAVPLAGLIGHRGS